MNFTILDEISIDKFSAESTLIPTDTTTKLTAVAKDGMGEYKYKFLLEDGTVLQEGTSNTCNFKADKAGNYKVKVVVSDNTSVTKEKEIEITVYDKVTVESFKATNTEALRKGDKVNFEVVANGGYGELTYTATLDDEVIYEGKSGNFTYCATKAGNLEFKVEVKDEKNNKAMITTSVVVNDELQINDFSTSLVSPQMLGTTINISGSAKGYIAPYSYNVTITNGDNNEVLNENSNEVQWTPDAVGTYTIKFTATNSLGESVTKEETFVIKDFKIKSFNVDLESPQKAGTTININGEAIGDGAPYSYEIVVVDENGKENVISNTNKAEWTPVEGGRYVIKLIATNSDKDEVVAEKEFEIKDFKIESFTSNIESPQIVGKTIKLSGDVKGYGYTYLYNISAIDEKGNVVFTSDNKEVLWNPEVAGKYTLRFTVTNNEGESLTKDITYIINEKPKNLTTIYYKGSNTTYIHYKIGTTGSWTTAPGIKMEPTSELSGFNNKITIDLGEETTLIACFNNGSGSWDNNSSKNYVFGVGTYTLSNKIITEITPVGLTLDNFTSDLASPQLINTEVTLKTSVSNVDGSAIYKVVAVKDGVESVIYYGDSNVTTWMPTESGNYTLRVEVTDNSGTIVKGEMPYKINEPLSLNSFEADNTTIEVGNKVTLNMVTNNGLGTIKYKFYLEDNTVIYEGTNNTATWIPNQSGEYVVYAKAYDESGAEVSSNVNVVVKEPKFAISNFTLSKTSPQKLGTSINISATAIGEGSPYTYKIEVLNKKGEVILTTNNNEVDWKATEVGEYTIKLTVSNGLGEELTSEKTFVIEDVSSTLTTIYYKGYSSPYIHYRIGSGAWTTAPGVAMKASTTMPGYYEITIDLGDATTLTACFNNGSSSWDNNNSKNYTFGIGKFICENKVITDITEKDLEISSFTTDKGNSTTLGKTVNISANAIYGSGDYKYKFTVIKDGTETVLSDYSDNSNINWNPSEVGKYTLKVLVMDSEGNIIEDTMSFAVSEVPKNIVKIYYTGYTNPYIHYKVGSGTWTTVPGKLMSTSTSNYGAYEFTIDLGNESLATVCFNNGNGSWDNNGGKNYTFTAGEFIFKNSTITKLN